MRANMIFFALLLIVAVGLLTLWAVNEHNKQDGRYRYQDHVSRADIQKATDGKDLKPVTWFSEGSVAMRECQRSCDETRLIRLVPETEGLTLFIGAAKTKALSPGIAGSGKAYMDAQKRYGVRAVFHLAKFTVTSEAYQSQLGPAQTVWNLTCKTVLEINKECTKYSLQNAQIVIHTTYGDLVTVQAAGKDAGQTIIAHQKAIGSQTILARMCNKIINVRKFGKPEYLGISQTTCQASNKTNLQALSRAL